MASPKKIFASLIVFLSVFQAGAQDFLLPSLDSIYRKLPMSGIDSSFVCRRTNEFGEICHIGFNLFEAFEMESNERIVCDFVERYLLERNLEEASTAYRRMKADKFFTFGATYDEIPLMRLADGMSISRAGTGFVLQLTRSGNAIVTFGFPADYQMILGAGYRDMHVLLRKELSRYVPCDSLTASSLSPDDLESSPQSGWYRKKGKWYISKLINSDLFYCLQKDSSLALVCDPNFVPESLANIFLAPRAEDHRCISVTFKGYEFARDDFQVPIYDLVSYMRSKGCDAYFGIEKYGKDSVSASVFFINEEFCYNHIIYLNIPLSVIEDKAVKVTGELFAFIPMHNVSPYIFEQYRDR